MYLGNIALLIINLPLVGIFSRLLTIPQKYMTPLIAVLAFIGVYSVVGNPFDLYMIIGLGIFGWILRKMGFSLAPIILGFVLGGLFEDNLRRALSISGGDWWILVQSGRSIGIYIAAILIIVVPMLYGYVSKTKDMDSTRTIERPQPKATDGED